MGMVARFRTIEAAAAPVSTPDEPTARAGAMTDRGTEAAQPIFVDNYDELVRVFKERIETMRISHLALDELAGLASGHSGKLLGPSQVKKFGALTTFVVAQALGLRLALIEDPEALAVARRRIVPKDVSRVYPGNLSRPPAARMIQRVLHHLARPHAQRERAKHWRLLAVASAKATLEKFSTADRGKTRAQERKAPSGGSNSSQT